MTTFLTDRDRALIHAQVQPQVDERFPKPPRDLSELAVKVDSMSPEMLPAAFRPWIEDVCNRMRVPIEMVAIPIMVSVATIVGRKLCIHPKRRDDWQVVPNLWACVVGRPGALKTPAMHEALRPFRRIEAQLREQYEGETEQRTSAQSVVALQIAAIEQQIKSAHKKAGSDLSDLTEQLAEKRRELKSFDATEPRLSTSDASVEKLGELLRSNPHGLLMHSDELIRFLKSLDKPGSETSRAFFLEGWNGYGSYTVDRIGRGTLHIPALCVSILGGTQPGPLRSYVREAMSDGSGADGPPATLSTARMAR